MHIFSPTLAREGRLSVDALSEGTLENRIRNAIQLYGASLGYAENMAYRRNDSLTSEFLDIVSLTWKETPGDQIIVDSRVHMLKPGWSPAIGGWHLDDIPRITQEDALECGVPTHMVGQPDVFNPRYKAEHLLCIVDSGTGSMTEFVTRSFMADPAVIHYLHGNSVYGKFDRILNAIPPVRVGDMTSVVKSGEIYSFGHEDWHRATPATGSGWRYFIRATRFTERKPKNEIRTQTQVYVQDFNTGW